MPGVNLRPAIEESVWRNYRWKWTWSIGQAWVGGKFFSWLYDGKAKSAGYLLSVTSPADPSRLSILYANFCLKFQMPAAQFTNYLNEPTDCRKQLTECKIELLDDNRRLKVIVMLNLSFYLLIPTGIDIFICYMFQVEIGVNCCLTDKMKNYE